MQESLNTAVAEPPSRFWVLAAKEIANDLTLPDFSEWEELRKKYPEWAEALSVILGSSAQTPIEDASRALAAFERLQR